MPKHAGGRPPGRLNKRTVEARETARLFLNSVPQSELRLAWKRALKASPTEALRIYHIALEFQAPKLSRVQVAGDPDKPFVMVERVYVEKGGAPADLTSSDRAHVERLLRGDRARLPAGHDEE